MGGFFTGMLTFCILLLAFLNLKTAELCQQQNLTTKECSLTISFKAERTK
jgi:hypothetical protein